MDVTITAHLDTPVVGDLGPLDGPLSWASWQDHLARGLPVPELTDDHAPDFPLPLGRWEEAGVWGWRISAPIGEPVHYSTHESRRRPATGPMAAYTKAREHHAGLGPMKAKNVILSQAHHLAIQWHADTTDRDELARLLGMITHLGARHRDGKGHVARWEITEGPAGGWRKRPMPTSGGRMMRARAPYWHPTERTPCA
ncbi:hypothetical protein [Corynebacterium freneyi]|uniref:Uncharacterized protein n=1 Tax=Corynebacterium freneyi TaxID=134034 RepID=A0ABS4U9U5_9CORY|nr:hypothetical protein [Corynebacterium freneyi]MBP2333323.1 hypothetical protein [Corynebacterium freneyi]QXA52624.1 hypothetical protein I6L56_11360 [Corynebacterium freneyi]WJZ04573.1 hypothetical protein CFREN_02935 [Corynebacterium freneyi]